MKTVLIFFRRPNENVSAQYFANAVNRLKDGGLLIDSVDALSIDDDVAFARRIDEYADTADNIIVLISKDMAFDWKKVITDKTGAEFIINDNALEIINDYSKQNGIRVDDECANLPMDATVIPNRKGMFQGFLLEQEGYTLITLPHREEELIEMCDGFVSPYFNVKYNNNYEQVTLKYFGRLDVLEKTLKEAEEKCRSGLKYRTDTVNGDTKIDLFFDNAVIKAERNDVLRKIIENLGDDVYAEYDVSLGERLFDLMQVRKVKIAVAESFTGGRISAEIVKNPGVSEYFCEGIVCYTDKSKVTRLGVKPSDIKAQGAVSGTVAFQMTAGLLRNTDCDVAISTTGLAGPNSDASGKPVGLCYIAVGTREGVHSYKYLLKGDREKITETAKNTAIFLAIKKIKKL